MITGPVTFIGDVHGWDGRLAAILEREPEGPWILLGDLVDRGPEVRAVVTRVRELCRAGRAACILGNHEYALVKGLGCAALGIAADPVAWQSWLFSHGAAPTLQSYGVTSDDPDDLRRAMGADLVFLAELPWVLCGRFSEADGLELPAPSVAPGPRAWLAVHAGLGAGLPWRDQVAALRDPGRLWAAPFDLVAPLYDKDLVRVVPGDLPRHVDLVSGHTPQARLLRLPQRIVCDTSGGRPGRPLSALRWPEGRVLSSAVGS